MLTENELKMMIHLKKALGFIFYSCFRYAKKKKKKEWKVQRIHILSLLAVSSTINILH